MKFKKKNIVYIALILSAYLIICLLKTDRSILQIQDYDDSPHRTYTELLTEPFSPDFNSITGSAVNNQTDELGKFSKLSKEIFSRSDYYRSDIPIRFVFSAARIPDNKNVILTQTAKIVSTQQKKSIHHKSSDDDAFKA